MFNALNTKLETTFKWLKGRGTLSEKDINAAMKEVRLALLEADVNFKVVREFCAEIAEKARGEAVLKSLSPGHQVIKIVHEQLIKVMGESAEEINLKAAPPVVIMLCGLQGSGKTTTAAKLALLLRRKYRRKPLLVPADVYRPAAIEQLKTLGRSASIPVFESRQEDDPVDIARNALSYASNYGFDVVIIDTAGRLQIDADLMEELSRIVSAVNPHEILLVADAMTGQEAVNVALGFHEKLDIDGLVLTKLDGDARGGAALSMRKVTGRPIKFVGVSEKPDGLEVFHPERMASRILGMGDVLTLIEKAAAEVNVEESMALQKKFKKNAFTLEDFLKQMKMMQRLGDMSSIASMIPGMGKIAARINPDDLEKELKKTEAIILSMTPQERQKHAIINGSRRKRIARGSGTRVEDVNKLIKQFTEMQRMMKKVSRLGAGQLMGMLGSGQKGLFS